MLHAGAVAQLDLVALAGAAAVQEGAAGGHEGGKDAVLHVKHGHVLVERELEPGGRAAVEEVQYLLDVQVVTDGELLQAGGLQELGREGIGHVEREIARGAQAGAGKEPDGPEVPDQDAVGMGPGDELEEPFLRGF